MKSKRLLFILSILSLSPFSMQALNINLGPFDFHIGGGISIDRDNFWFYSDSICSAIENRHLLEITLQAETTEAKPVKILIEPYLYGYDENGALRLHGVHVEKIVSSIEPETESHDRTTNEGYVGGIFSVFSEGKGWQDIGISKVLDIRVLTQTEFKPRRVEEKTTIVKPICGLHP